jgi:hypothetical protein
MPLEYLMLSSGIYVNQGKNINMTSACIETFVVIIDLYSSTIFSLKKTS